MNSDQAINSTRTAQKSWPEAISIVRDTLTRATHTGAKLNDIIVALSRFPGNVDGQVTMPGDQFQDTDEERLFEYFRLGASAASASLTSSSSRVSTPHYQASQNPTHHETKWWQFWKWLAVESNQEVTKSPTDTGSPESRVKSALKAWYRQQAETWWSRTPKKSAICDDCNGELPKGEGFLRPGNNLACEECTDRLLDRANWERALKNVDEYFGPGIPEHVRRLAR